MKITPTPGFSRAVTNPSFLSVLPLSGLKLWLDAADTSTITDTGTFTWADKSGNGYHVTQSVAGNKPVTGTATINGRNALTFSGTKFLSLPSALYSLTNTNNTVFCVVRHTSLSGLHRVLNGKNGSATNYGILAFTNATDFNIRNGGSVIGATTYNTNAHIQGSKRTGAAQQAIYDGVILNEVSNAANSVITELTLGWDTALTSGQGLIGNIAEVIIYDRALSMAESNQVGRYLAAKWGISWYEYPVTNFPTVSSIVAFGDSITEGSNAATAADRWANKLAFALRATLLNQGLGGTVLQNSNGAGGTPLANNGRDRYVAALTGTNKRDLAVILYGLNDLRYTLAPSSVNVTNFTNDYQEIITGLMAAGYSNNHILLASPSWLPTAGYMSGGYTGSNRTIHESYVAAVRQLAVTNNVFYADVYGYMRDNGGDSLIDTDNIHPTTAGHAAIYNAMIGAAKVT